MHRDGLVLHVEEDFALADNLMIEGAVLASGGALVLVLMILLISLAARYATRGKLHIVR